MQKKQITVSDLILWQQFRAGDGAALEELMTLYFRVLFNYGSKFSRNHEFVKDCIQDLFLHIWQSRQNLNADVNVKAYLLASLRRQIYRGLKSKATLPLTHTWEPALDFALEFSVEETYIQDEGARVLAQEIKFQLEQLPKRQREVVYLKFFEGLSRDQIAEVMGINDQSVSNHLQLAVKQLKANWNSAVIALFLILIRF